MSAISPGLSESDHPVASSWNKMRWMPFEQGFTSSPNGAISVQ